MAVDPHRVAPSESPFRCPQCSAPLSPRDAAFECVTCGATYPARPFPDFLPSVSGREASPAEVHEGWLNRCEEMAMEFRAREFYAPVLSRLRPLEELRVLDDGCGNGRLVDELQQLGVDAWGIDPGARSERWNDRVEQGKLVRASGLVLPFVDGWFDAVISAGVLEHVGEHKPERRDLRAAYVGEALRVLRPGGVLLLSQPNGACPIDFWHGGRRGMRFHRPYEKWMPNAREIRQYVRRAAPGARIRFLSPKNYISFQRVVGDPLGRKLLPLGRFVIWLAHAVPFLRSTPLNPKLIVEVVKPGGQLRP